MRRERVLLYIAFISRFSLVVIFLFAAAAALSDPFEFVPNMSSLVGGRWAVHASIAVVLAELVAVVLLMAHRTVRAGGWWAACLLVSFTVYPLYYLHVLGGGPLKCRCFGGIIVSDSGVVIVVRNLLLLAPAAVVIFYNEQKPTQPVA